MLNRLKNKKNIHKYGSVTSFRIFTLLGLAWIITSLLLLIHSDIMTGITKGVLGNEYCQACPTTSLFTITSSVLVFFIGGLGISYDIVRTEKNTVNQSRKNRMLRIVVFAFAVSLASQAVYYWANLFINGI